MQLKNITKLISSINAGMREILSENVLHSVNEYWRALQVYSRSAWARSKDGGKGEESACHLKTILKLNALVFVWMMSISDSEEDQPQNRNSTFRIAPRSLKVGRCPNCCETY